MGKMARRRPLRFTPVEKSPKLRRLFLETEKKLRDKRTEHVTITKGGKVYHKLGPGFYSIQPLKEVTGPLGEKAKTSERKRAAFAFAPASDKIERRHMLNFINKGSYIPPHMHPTAVEKWKATKGRFKAISMDATGNVTQAKILTPSSKTLITKPGTYHTIVALKEGSILHEEVPGPYDPKTYKVQQPWAPAEGTPESIEYFKRLEKARKR